ncbi:hypothetical protein [Aneurinibacillus tyrosinisolvens]|uniref:hypothetical protein n=1 Tax=Aneurinibacillus tyrosinisolvens TaxID=1443435 RepID=UPI00063F29AD|nr:hypothetical protein [Aneurinibacillus tyrosinisolvens]
MTINEELIKSANEFVRSIAIDIPVVEWDGSLGRHESKEGVIKLNINAIRDLYMHHKEGLPYAESFEQYVMLILCHELGHYRDNTVHSLASEFLEGILSNIWFFMTKNNEIYMLLFNIKVGNLTLKLVT